ncbi:MAG: hypothetical protein LBB94_12530 [Clostridiales bacterium]|nr:hypothetical protein [Clostridiales bacterium]
MNRIKRFVAGRKYLMITAVSLTLIGALTLGRSFAWFADVDAARAVKVDTAPNGEKIIREAVPIGNTGFTVDITTTNGKQYVWFPGESIAYRHTLTNASKIPIVFRVTALQDESLNVDFFDNTDQGFSVNDMHGMVLSSRKDFPAGVSAVSPKPVMWGEKFAGNEAEYFGFIGPKSSAVIETSLDTRHSFEAGENTNVIGMGMPFKTHIRFDACQADPITVMDYFGFNSDVLEQIKTLKTPAPTPDSAP